MNALQSFISARPFGFLTAADMPELIKLDRLCPVLVRCGACRFTCAAQYCAHLLECIAAGGDYVRDVSFPVGSLERAADWRSLCPSQELKVGAVIAKPYVDAWTQEARRPALSNHFNEGDCGGVFDGFSVTSDADPGL